MEKTPSYPRRSNINLKNLPPINPRIGNGNHSSIPAKFEKSRYIRRVPQFTPPNHWPEMEPNGYDGSLVKPVSSVETARALNTKTIPEAPLGSTDVKECFSDTKKENSREVASTCSCRHGSTKEAFCLAYHSLSILPFNPTAYSDSHKHYYGVSEKHCTSEKRAAKSLLFEICNANYWKPPLFECREEEGAGHAKKFRFKVIVEMKGASGAVLECYGAPQTRKKVAAEHAAEGALWYLKHLGCRSKR